MTPSKKTPPEAFAGRRRGLCQRLKGRAAIDRATRLVRRVVDRPCVDHGGLGVCLSYWVCLPLGWVDECWSGKGLSCR